MNDGESRVQIINGTAGIGKSSFFMYMLERMRRQNKPALLHYHRKQTEVAMVIFFPANGSEPQVVMQNHPDYFNKFNEWYGEIDRAKSVFLVDGIVSFANADFPNVTYVAAKSPSCVIGWMETSQNRQDRWRKVWCQAELLSYATQVGIPNAQNLIAENMLHLGGVSRYVFAPGAAEKRPMLPLWGLVRSSCLS